jgi:hypothetical protein
MEPGTTETIEETVEATAEATYIASRAKKA